MKLELASIKTPGLEVMLKDGSTRTYDPFDIARRAESRLVEGIGLGGIIGVFRELLELGPDDATDYQVLYLQKTLIELTKQLTVGKVEPPTLQS